MHIFELNDRNVVLHGPEDILVQSPGFANIADKTPVFGDEARRTARLHPRQTFSQFWSQLSMDPLVNSNNHFRHQADLAFAHLNAIAGQQAPGDEVVFAVPSNYNRNQLAILLGLVKSCQFDAVGLVDLSLLRTADAGNPARSIYLDIQLHQSVLTTFSQTEGKFARDKIIQIPGTGLLSLHDAWANMITDEFIRQSRFDPQHNAETEQYVYNQLDAWIAATKRDNEVLMEINNKGTVYQARVNQGHFEQRVRNIFNRIKTEIETVFDGDYTLVLPADLGHLPGLDLYLRHVEPVAGDRLAAQCRDNLAHIRGEPGSLGFITSLPMTGKRSLPATSPAGGTIPRFTISCQGADLVVEPVADNQVLVNGQPVEGARVLAAGDRLNIGDAKFQLQLVETE